MTGDPARRAAPSSAAKSPSDPDSQVDPGALALVRRIAAERPVGPWRLQLDGLVNQSRAPSHEFDAMRERLARLLDAAAQAMPACPFQVELPREGNPSLTAGGTQGAALAECVLAGAAYVIDDGGAEWELFLKLRCPGEPTWVVNRPVRLRAGSDGGRPQLVVPDAWMAADAGTGAGTAPR